MDPIPSKGVFIYVHIPKDGISCQSYSFTPQLTSRHNNKPVYRLQQQSIRRLVLVPPYSVFCSISFRCGGLSIERSQKPLTPESTLAVTHHDRQKQVEVKRSSRANPHEIRLFSALNRSHPLMDNLSPLTPPHLSSKPPSPSSSESLYPFRYSN